MKNEKEIVSSERRCGDLRSMDAVVGVFARKILGRKAFVEADVIANWSEIVGEELAKLTKPIRISFKKDERKGGVLYIEAASGALALELQQKSKIVISKVNVFFGYEAVARLRIMQNLQIAKEVSLSSDNSEKKLVSEEEENYIRQQLKGIDNQELRATLEKLGRAIIANHKKNG